MKDTPNTIQLVQYNCNLQPKTTQSLLDNLDPNTHHIITLQEPYTARQPRTTHHKNYKHIRSPDTGPKGIGACLFVSNALPGQYWQSSIANEDLLSLSITLTNNNTL